MLLPLLLLLLHGVAVCSADGGARGKHQPREWTLLLLFGEELFYCIYFWASINFKHVSLIEVKNSDKLDALFQIFHCFFFLLLFIL